MEWSQFKDEFEMGALECIERLELEYSRIRSGRVNISIFDTVKVEAYGEYMNLNQVANLQIVDARQVLVKPYDRSQIQDIAKALSASHLGITPQVNADNIRLSFPSQTEENRIKNVKKAKEILEQCKAKLRDVRKDVQGGFKKATGVSEDLIRYFEEELNKITKEYNSKLESIFEEKEKELMTI